MPQEQAILVGIAGGTGSGKTTICRRLASELGDLAVFLSCDNYYHSLADLSDSDREKVNFDHPDAIDFELLASHLSLLSRGDDVDVPEYCFTTHTRTEVVTRVSPRPVTIVEGILLFVCEDVRDQFDLRVFVDTESEKRLERRLKRDVVERGRTVESVHRQWNETVLPMYEQFVAPTQRFANLTIQTGESSEVSVGILSAGIRSLVADR